MSGPRRSAQVAVLDALLALVVLGMVLAVAAMTAFAAAISIGEIFTPTPDGVETMRRAEARTAWLGRLTVAAGILLLLVDALVVVLSLRRLRSGDPARPAAILSLVAIATGSVIPLVVLLTSADSVLALLTLVFALPPVRLAQLIAGATATSAQGRSGVETAG